MKTVKTQLFSLSTKIAKNARLILFVITMLMFVLAAGAPECGGTVGH